jgi:hypothetical protein
MDSSSESPTTVVIAKFVGHKLSHQDLEAWLQGLNLELRGNCLTLCRKVGQGYFFVGKLQE